MKLWMLVLILALFAPAALARPHSQVRMLAKQPFSLKAASDEGSPISSQVGGERQLDIFMAALKKAVAADDRRKVASMILYPIVIVAGDRSVLFRTPASLIPSYDLVFTPYLKKQIAAAKPEEMFSNWQGAMIHNGELWVNEVAPNRLKIVTIQNQTGRQIEVKPKAPGFKVHPKVFSLIENSESDSKHPIVREIDLDAFALNNNHFQKGEVKQEGEWFKYSQEEGRGFLTYRVVENRGNRYTVEFLDNGGGTMTDSALIEFIVQRRAIRKDGKLKTIRVLRVLSYTSR